MTQPVVVAPMNVAGKSITRFDTAGFTGPVRLLSEVDCCSLVTAHTNGEIPPGRDWHKGVGASSRLIYDVASRSCLVDRVSELLGDDVMLWGGMLVARPPGQRHLWHTDIETAAPDAAAVSVWIGLENTTRESSLRLLAGSHRLGKSLQQVAHERGCHREDLSEVDLVSWVDQCGVNIEVVVPDMTDGDAVFFDGRLWHGSHNENSSSTRLALLLQYATPDTPIRMPNSSHLEWPFQFLADRPPVVKIRGEGRDGPNRFVSAPPLQVEGVLREPWVRQLDLPLDQYSESGWSSHSIFHGRTPSLGKLSCHASVLDPESSPHPPHEHDEEEILIVLDGRAELVIRSGDGEKRVLASSNTLAYYPAGCFHTLRNRSDAPVTYVMFKWSAADQGCGNHLRAEVHDFSAAPLTSAGQGHATANVLGGATRYLRTLHAHSSTVAPGGGYEAHADAYDVAIVVTDGVIETVGQEVRPGGVVFYPAGEPHGLRNRSARFAAYLVIEFHGSGGSFVRPRPTRWTRARKWGRGRARAMARRLRGLGSHLGVSR